MKRLRDHGLTPSNIAKTPANKLESILIPVSFYKVRLLADGEIFEGVRLDWCHRTEYCLIYSTARTAYVLEPMLPKTGSCY